MEPFDGHFDYCRLIGKLNYLKKCTKINVTCTAHQCTRFVSEPKDVDGKAVKWIGRYFAATKDKGIIMKPDKSKGFEVYVDASFVGDWNNETAKSRLECIYMFASCPILWTSRIQSGVALSTTESKHIAISHVMREVLPLIKLMDKLQDKGVIKQSDKPVMRCRVFEDNNGAVELATSIKSPKMRPRTKHINTKCHHFRQQVREGQIVIKAIGTEDMLADILTKVVNEETLLRLRPQIMGSW